MIFCITAEHDRLNIFTVFIFKLNVVTVRVVMLRNVMSIENLLAVCLYLIHRVALFACHNNSILCAR